VCHNHLKHCGFETATFIEGDLRGDDATTRQRGMPFEMLVGLVQREMLPAYSDSWITVKGKAITDFYSRGLSKCLDRRRRS